MHDTVEPICWIGRGGDPPHGEMSFEGNERLAAAVQESSVTGLIRILDNGDWPALLSCSHLESGFDEVAEIHQVEGEPTPTSGAKASCGRW